MWLNFTSARSSSVALAMISHPTRSCSTSSSWTISKMISSTAGIAVLITNVPAVGADIARKRVSWRRIRQIALDAAPIAGRARHLAGNYAGRTASRVFPDATEQKIARGGPQPIMDHSTTQHEAYRHDHAEDRCRDEKDPFSHRQPQMSLAPDVASPFAPLLSVRAKML